MAAVVSNCLFMWEISDANIGLADSQYRPEKVADVQLVGFVEMNKSNDIFIDERKQNIGTCSFVLLNFIS